MHCSLHILAYVINIKIVFYDYFYYWIYFSFKVRRIYPSLFFNNNLLNKCPYMSIFCTFQRLLTHSIGADQV